MRTKNRLSRLEEAREARRQERRLMTQGAQEAVKRLTHETPGLVIQEAAPLLFQAMCRREGITVLFTECPRTDGKTIWLGPIDLTSSLAPVFVYGHGCHERHHVVYTDFSVVTQVQAGPVQRFFNIFEDIRIDRLGSEDYAGYLLWRSALFDAYEETGLAPWSHLTEMNAAVALEVWLYASLEVSQLGFDQLRSRVAELRDKARSAFGEALLSTLERDVTAAFPLDSTGASLKLAKRVVAAVDAWAKQAEATFAALDRQIHGEAGQGSHQGAEGRCSVGDPAPLWDGQGSLFALDGEPTRAASVVTYLPGYSEALAAHEAYQHFSATDRPSAFVACDEHFRALLMPETVQDIPEAMSTISPDPISKADYEGFTMTEELVRERESDFMRFWQGSSALSRAFQASLEARVRVPDLVDRQGWEVDDTILWQVAYKEERLFLRDRVTRDKDTAVEVLLDSSGSMVGQLFSMAKVVALRLFEALNAQRRTRASLALFPGPACRGIGLVGRSGERTAAVIPRLASIPSRGPTPMIPALFWAASRLVAQEASRKVIFVITDGAFREPVAEMITACESLGITTVMLGIGESSTPQGRHFAKVATMAELPQATVNLLKALQADLNAYG